MKRFLLIFAAFLLNATVYAQQASHDLTFNPADLGFKHGDGPYVSNVDPYPYFRRVAVQADGKILCSGHLTKYNGKDAHNLLRLNADGNLDTTFMASGAGLIATINVIIPLANGKIIVAGSLYTHNGTAVKNVIRLNADGTLDQSFSIDPQISSGTDDTVNAIAIQPDGKMLIARNFYNMIRVDANGTLDPTFNLPAYAFESPVYALALQSDGKIIAGGNFTKYDTTTCNRIVRLNTDGSLDSTFGTAAGASGAVKKIIVLPNDKLVIIGDFNYVGGLYKPFITKLNANGTLDNTFTPGNFKLEGTTTPALYSMRLQPDGKLLISGYFKMHGPTPLNTDATIAGAIIRLNANGTRDTAFSAIGADDQIYDIALQPDGKIITAGLFETFGNVARRRIARANSDGTNDMTFNTGTGLNGAVYHTKVLPDDKILIAGNFRLYNGLVRNRIAKLNQDGTPDIAFAASALIDGTIETFEVQPDGKILIGGNFKTVNGLSRSKIARLNADSSLDTTFNVGTGFSGTGNSLFQVNDFALQNDGKILVAGHFTTFNGVNCNRIVRLTANGTLDTGFNIGTAANDVVGSVCVQTDGKIIVGGSFTSFNGTAKSRVVRLNTDGSFDSTFTLADFTHADGLQTAVSTLVELPNGKILLEGNFTYRGSPVGPIIRLNHDGSHDPTFEYAYLNYAINTFVVQPDGSLIVGTNYWDDEHGSGLANVFKLDTTGHVADDFSMYFFHLAGPNNTVYGLDQQSDGKIIIGGSFDAVGTTGRNRLARINNTFTLATNQSTAVTADAITYVKNDALYIESEKVLQAIAVYNIQGKLLYENNNITETKFVIENIKRANQLLILKATNTQGKVKELKTVF